MEVRGCSLLHASNSEATSISFTGLVLRAHRATVPCSEQFTTASHNELRQMVQLQTQTEKLENPRRPCPCLCTGSSRNSRARGHFKQHTIAFKELVQGSARRTTIPCSEQFATASWNEVRPMVQLQTQTEKLENPRRPRLCLSGYIETGDWFAIARSCHQSLFAV